MENLTNGQRWVIWVAILITTIVIVVYITGITAIYDYNDKRFKFNGNIIFFGIISIIWINVYMGFKLRLKEGSY